MVEFVLSVPQGDSETTAISIWIFFDGINSFQKNVINFRVGREITVRIRFEFPVFPKKKLHP